MTANPWKTKNSKLIYQNKWIKLREDQVITPAGTDGIYSVVETHPAIGIVALSENLETYLVGQYRYPLDIYSWEIPEGGGHPGETPLQSAKRELREETGLQASEWTYLDMLYTSNCFTNETGHIFLARELIQYSAQPEQTEALQIKKVPFRDAYRMVLDYEIKDAMAIIGIIRTYHWLKARNLITG
jgi:8-oxo-dGTP pyrophosphatase MutT (NUDIX family)